MSHSETSSSKMSAMTCQEVQKFVHAYLDDEFAEEDRLAFAAHLQTCERCRQIARFEERFKQRLRLAAEHAAAPPALVARVKQALAAADKRESFARRWAWRSIAAAAALALVAGVMVSRRVEFSNLSALSTLGEESIQWHRQQLPLDVTSSSLEPIRRFFSDKVRFAIRPPSLREPKARLVGARLSHLGEHRALYLVYEVGGQRLSVFLTDPGAMPAMGAPRVRVGDHDVYVHGSRGYNVAMFVSGGTGYAIASEMDPRRLTRLISLTE